VTTRNDVEDNGGLVSVYMAAHNAEAFIGAAIDSVLAQSCERFELIVVDDASTDGTVNAVLERDDERIRLVCLAENVGPGAARNAALDVASGDWLAVMDADDVMHPERLASLSRWSVAHPGRAILVDDSVRWYPDATLLDELLAAEVPDEPRFRDVPAHEWLRRHLGGKPMFRRELLADTGVRYPDFRAGQDTSFLIQLAARAGEPITWVHVPTYLYRFVEGSLSTRTRRRLDEVERMLRDLRSRFELDELMCAAADTRLEALADERLVVELESAWADRRLREAASLALRRSNRRRVWSLLSTSISVRARRLRHRVRS
jgi:glycosyltransferase involved in cell wall biosynthesis